MGDSKPGEDVVNLLSRVEVIRTINWCSCA
jgi:hypothetical protein